ncbi:MAG: two-component system, OmpR family, response regulator [Clostridiales bacterium]|nr:two-component system, OmpR family, response regulator [Clostridiales bacterium]MDK2992843.1 two-component system, OmpR family, response regulator [Clostridiales bacterium]
MLYERDMQMADNYKILIIDDDKNICQLLNLYFTKEGFEVDIANNGKEGMSHFSNNPPNIVILDIMLPGKDGWDVCREIRRMSDIPIIMLTAKSETFDKVLGLELGADDYVVKPFDPKELIARVKAVLRRYNQDNDANNVIVYPNLVIDKNTMLVKYQKKELELPPKEFELLYFLASHPNKIYTREQLLEQVWGFDYYGDSRTVDVHVNRLREKIGSENDPWKISTVWGVGYKFEVK